MDRSVANDIDFFQKVFTVVMALALGEAFKQFVADAKEPAEDKTIHWNRLPALVSFIFLIVPFYHGMSRYYYTTYSTVAEGYSGHLLFDSGAFLLESALFFTLSRALSPGRWRTYYIAVIILFVLDCAWAFTGNCGHSSTDSSLTHWMIQDIGGVAFMSIACWYLWKKPRSLTATLLCAALMLLKAIVDYAWSWSYYFPPAT
jgi:hypothetical protein